MNILQFFEVLEMCVMQSDSLIIDCKISNTSKVETNLCRAKKMMCRNAAHPDLHGHYREARYTQTKHHWWWKANYVFEGIRVLRNYTGEFAHFNGPAEP